MDKLDLMIGDQVYYTDANTTYFVKIKELKDDNALIQLHDGAVASISYDKINPIKMHEGILSTNFRVADDLSQLFSQYKVPFYLLPLPFGKVKYILWVESEGESYLKIENLAPIKCYYLHEFRHILRLLGYMKELN